VGEKIRAKSKGKTVKSTKHGLRPHELREQQDAFKSAAVQPVPRSGASEKSPRA